MINYLDRTYCEGPCSALDCSRQLTNEVEAAAERSGLLLAISDLREGCPQYRAPIPKEKS